MTSPLPDANDPSVVLAVASPDEQREACRATHPSWGPGLSLQQYLDREMDLLTTALARDGGLTPWILTDSSDSSAPRRILASCDTIRKRAVVARPDGTLTDVTAYGVASVFTAPPCRSRGYAGRMMALLGEELARRDPAAAFSVLWSDIGPTFYAKHQWVPIGNSHLELPVAASPPRSTPAGITELGDAHLPELAARDEQLLRAELSKPGSSAKTRVAVLPDISTLKWHCRREAHMLRGHLGRDPDVHGALYTPPGDGGAARRVWGLWVRSRYGGGEGEPVVTILHFLRLVVEDGAATRDEELAVALEGIMAVARREAADADCRSVALWNPPARVLAAFRGQRLAPLGGEVVERDTDSLASLRWFGQGSVDDIEWVANEKFAWC
ncbi:Acyl-CoA N-acyltransferase [Cordyceps fumosorosea ARSEF 2679]|uniref:Acyl-CoA N-acyltransferase n=1 Tax=Cordyceps fumosorosea (strain ARSEF 2679) TaxID=1081104 RepID=A0A167TPH8_CORFA|nr:Acyl-CoA N-acyltransferase [Cordyceps fumosorosea ARSEF 2679]OAA60812.1 Acyl-CoA N-acyltransferase [Cordyceps fumosorosea ARSEF 2679]